jgi:hypothetical protein
MNTVAFITPASSGPFFRKELPVPRLEKNTPLPQMPRKLIAVHGTTHYRRADSTIASASLVELIRVARARSQVDPEYSALADAAAHDAAAMVHRLAAWEPPSVKFSSDGVLTLQWQSNEFGLAMILVGEGEVSIALRRPGQFYAENGIDIAVSDELPLVVKNFLDDILR